MAFSLETVAKICRGERRASPLFLPSSLVLTLLITGSPAGLDSLPPKISHFFLLHDFYSVLRSNKSPK